MLIISIYAVFTLLLLAAAICDLKTMEIPNRISVIMALGFAPAAIVAGLPWSVLALHYGIGVVMLLIMAALFYVGFLGGGDAKLIAATAVWFGPNTMFFLLIMALAGGAAALLLIALRRTPLRDKPPFNRGAIPYAVAIAVGGIAGLTHLPFAP